MGGEWAEAGGDTWHWARSDSQSWTLAWEFRHEPKSPPSMAFVDKSQPNRPWTSTKQTRVQSNLSPKEIGQGKRKAASMTHWTLAPGRDGP